jgi:hypothetical protein
MPDPIDGLVAIAEYGSKFEPDVVVNLLLDNGIAATTSYDPALNSVAAYMATDRTVEVMVRKESAGQGPAVTVILGGDLNAIPDEPQSDNRATKFFAHSNVWQAHSPAQRTQSMQLMWYASLLQSSVPSELFGVFGFPSSRKWHSAQRGILGLLALKLSSVNPSFV